MTRDAGWLFAWTVLGSIAAICLLGISRIRSRDALERGHLALSILPWAHLASSYAVAAYVRLGFGAWPRPCIDNPDLPMIGALVLTLVLGLIFLVSVGSAVWLGWLVIRMRRGMRRYWLASGVLYVTGIVLIFTAQVMDPWKFWAWVWD